MRKLFIFLIFNLFFGYQTIAQGDLLITPTRVVFEGNKQKEALNLVNIGKDTATYSVSFIQYNMKEDGSYITIVKPDSGQMFADPYLRIFPRRVTLAPGEPQVVMLQFRRKTDMPAGEYRSHLYFRSELNYNPLGLKNTAYDSTKVSVQLIPIFGISIPIIIRMGEVQAGASLSNLDLETRQDSIQVVKFTIHRTGNISIYGDITIEFISSQSKIYDIGKVKGLAVYTNVNKRNIEVRINNQSNKSLKSGKLRIKYISSNEAKPEVYAEGELEL